MTRSFKDSFARIGGAVVQEYKEHGRLRGISTEILNDAFDAGEKLGDAVRKYAPQAADTAKTQGENAASAAKTQGEKAVKAAKEYGDKAISKVRQYGDDAAEQAKDTFSKAGDDIRKAVSSDESGYKPEGTEDAATPADSASKPANEDTDAEKKTSSGHAESESAPVAEDSPEAAQAYGIDPADAQQAIDGIDKQIAEKNRELESVFQKIDKEQSKQKPDSGVLRELEDRQSTLNSSIEYLEESKKAFRESVKPESNK